MKLIEENPFRVLGVYANSPKRDIVANKGKANAFLKVSRAVEYPLDLKGTLPPLTRTLDMMNEAEAHLSIAREQIKYAQFWFLKMTPLDEIAFNHLFAGNMTEAMEIWSKQDSVSSLQNRLVCNLIENKPWIAAKTAEDLYHKFGNEYIIKVDVNCTLQMTPVELLHQFIDSLGEEVGMQKLSGYHLSSETRTYICSQTVGPLINKISAEVEKTKKVDHKDPKARLDAAKKLIESTKEAFEQLKSILPVTDSQFQMIADKLGLEILQCGIDYFIGMKDHDEEAPYTSMKILKYANTAVVGKIAKDRCEDQIKELQKYIDNLSPREVKAEDKAIKEELANFVRLPDKISYVITLLNNTKPHLQSIKRKLGAKNAYYLKLSTLICGNALHNIIEEVNAAQKGDTIEIGGQIFKVPVALMTPYQRMEMLERIKTVVGEAWKATIMMEDFDMEASFRLRYNENRSTLKSMCNQMGIVILPSLNLHSKKKSCFYIVLASLAISIIVYFCNYNGYYWDPIGPYLMWGAGLGIFVAIMYLLISDLLKD